MSLLRDFFVQFTFPLIVPILYDVLTLHVGILHFKMVLDICFGIQNVSKLLIISQNIGFTLLIWKLYLIVQECFLQLFDHRIGAVDEFEIWDHILEFFREVLKPLLIIF